MCVLVVPDEMKVLQQESQNDYSHEFESYWLQQQKDQINLVELEKEQDRSFLEMVKYQQLP